VSKTTVSLALRMNPKIPETTRKRISEVAATLGYCPDPALARIAAHRWKTRTAGSGSTIAFVTTDHPAGGYLDGAAITGAKRRAQELGYHLEHHRLESYANVEHLGRTLYHRGIQGVIIGQLFRSDFAQSFPWEKFATVACNIGYYDLPVHLVAPDHAQAMGLAWKRSHERGYRRIGLVLFDEQKAIDEADKAGAYLFYQSSLPREQHVPIVHIAPRDHDTLAAWLEAHRPDMILGINNIVRHWAQHRGWKIPADAGFIDLYAQPSINPSSGLFLDNQQLGCSAVELVDLQIQHGAFGIPRNTFNHLLLPAWIDGDSSPWRGTSTPATSGLKPAEPVR